MEDSSQTTSDIPSKKQLFVPQETPDHPFDVTLVVEYGKAFKAHRLVLSEASPFFEKLLNSGMRESSEGVVRLEMLTELGLSEILEFIYTGSVRISAEDSAQELIELADYLFLPHLKTVAGRVLMETVNASNSISMYYLAERYGCEELISESQTFILANFPTVAKTEDFLSLSSKEVKMWISSDEINVSSEEDLFNIILTWIGREKSERKKDFSELFREVRLVYVSRDYLHSDIATNALVNDNEGCMDLVKDAMKFVESKRFHHYSKVRPRKSIETPVIVVCLKGENRKDKKRKDQMICYYPREDKWSSSCFRGSLLRNIDIFTSCRGKLYFVSQQDKRMLCYDSFSNCWTSMPLEEQRTFHELFVTNGDEIYALVSTQRVVRSRGWCGNAPYVSRAEIVSFHITKYKPEANSWEDVSTFDGSIIRPGSCFVSKDNFIYFLGGRAIHGDEAVTDADRYDLRTNKWEKISNTQEPRYGAAGAAVGGKIFIVGGWNDITEHKSCEMFNETTNEWQFVASLNKGRFSIPFLVCVDNKLYLYNSYISSPEQNTVECYDPDRNEWHEKTQIPIEGMLSVQPRRGHDLICCSVTVFKGSQFIHNTSAEYVDERRCTIM